MKTAFKEVKLTDLSQVETLVQTTQAFTEQLVIMNRLLQEINQNTNSQVTFFTSRDGFIKLMNETLSSNNVAHIQNYNTIIKDVKTEINSLYLKLAASLAVVIGVAVGILKVFG